MSLEAMNSLITVPSNFGSNSHVIAIGSALKRLRQAWAGTTLLYLIPLKETPALPERVQEVKTLLWWATISLGAFAEVEGQVRLLSHSQQPAMLELNDDHQVVCSTVYNGCSHSKRIL